MFKVETTPRFDNELIVILDFIALDSTNMALDFFDNLMEKLYNIPDNPFIYRQKDSMDKDTREVIYKGYTVPIYIDNNNETIFILGIFNQNFWN